MATSWNKIGYNALTAFIGQGSLCCLYYLSESEEKSTPAGRVEGVVHFIFNGRFASLAIRKVICFISRSGNNTSGLTISGMVIMVIKAAAVQIDFKVVDNTIMRVIPSLYV